jgi:hypothetical protein
LFGADPKIGLSSSSIPKELLLQLETEEDIEKRNVSRRLYATPAALLDFRGLKTLNFVK